MIIKSTLKIVPLKGTYNGKPCDVYDIRKLTKLLNISPSKLQEEIANKYTKMTKLEVLNTSISYHRLYLRVSPTSQDKVGFSRSLPTYNITADNHNWVLGNNEEYL